MAMLRWLAGCWSKVSAHGLLIFISVYNDSIQEPSRNLKMLNQIFAPNSIFFFTGKIIIMLLYN